MPDLVPYSEFILGTTFDLDDREISDLFLHNAVVLYRWAQSSKAEITHLS